MRRDACSAVGTVGARTPHALPTMLALRRGSRCAEPGRGRAGGRQEYRLENSLAQPYASPSFARLRIRAGPTLCLFAVPQPLTLLTSCRVPTFRGMSTPPTSPGSSAPSPFYSPSNELGACVATYQQSGDLGR